MTLILCKTDTLINSGRILSGFTPHQTTEWEWTVSTKPARSHCHYTLIPVEITAAFFPGISSCNCVVVLNVENAQKPSANIHLGNVPLKYLIMNSPKVMKYRKILLYSSSSHIGTKLKNHCNNIISTSCSVLLTLVPPQCCLTLWLSSF